MSFIDDIKKQLEEKKKQKELEEIAYNIAVKKEKELFENEILDLKKENNKQRIKDIQEKAKRNVRNPFHKKLIKGLSSTIQKGTDYIVDNLQEKKEKKK